MVSSQYRLGWQMPPSILDRIETTLISNQCRNLLELGSGESTKFFSALVDSGKLSSFHSIEHLEAWVEHVRRECKSVTLHHCPLIDGWYDLTQFNVKSTFDALLVDGPPGMLTPDGMTRLPAIAKLKPWLSPNAIIFLDDMNRIGERRIAHEWEQDCDLLEIYENRLGVFRLQQ